MPPPETFERPEDYYSTRFHEMAHATGAAHRLDRKLNNRYGDSDYSKEELVAEMAAAFLCARCGIDRAVIENQASYLQGWMKALRNDSRLLVTAASQAQRAANYIQGITREVILEPETQKTSSVRPYGKKEEVLAQRSSLPELHAPEVSL